MLTNVPHHILYHQGDSLLASSHDWLVRDGFAEEAVKAKQNTRE